jgi:hypothetical protein
MDRGERRPRQRLGQLTGQPRPVREEPQRHRSRVGHDTRPVTRHRQPRRPRRMLHLRSASRVGGLVLSQDQVPLTGQALSRIQTHCHPPTRERCGLSHEWTLFTITSQMLAPVRQPRWPLASLDSSTNPGGVDGFAVAHKRLRPRQTPPRVATRASQSPRYRFPADGPPDSSWTPRTVPQARRQAQLRVVCPRNVTSY